MIKNRFFNEEKAQGMVEFALVLPILLLVILGIIGFGHLFFTYSSTVSASREAARFGSAVGVTANGIPRYQDCDQIRAAAIRAGLFAGVANTEASVDISYDEGPGTSEFGSCPVGGTGPEVALGDRILITVVVPYRSIVPLVNIPSFNLTATTRRTIVRSLQIGDAPTAEPLCPLTDVYMEIMGEDSTAHTMHSVVGQPVNFLVAVTSEDGTTPTTANGLYLFDHTIPASPLFTWTGNAPSFTNTYTFWNAGEYLISGVYVGDIDCYDDSSLPDQRHVVDAASTLLVINAPVMDAEYTTQAFTPISIPVDVTLSAVAPGARASWEGVQVVVSSVQSLGSCTATLDATGHGSCPLTFNAPGAGLTRNIAIRADFAGDPNYQLSSAFVDITLREVEPTLIPTTTLVPTSTPAPTATPGIRCPYFATGSIQQNGTSLSFQITNPALVTVKVTSLALTWPTDPIAKLKEVRFDWSNYNNACSASSNAPNCIFEAKNVNQQVAPPSYNDNNVKNGSMIAGYTYTMLFDFSYPLTTVVGNYQVTIGFDQSCPAVVINYTR